MQELPPLICAHGGDAAGAGAPPNTIRAFQAAVKNGFRCVEVDVALSMDGHPVVLHSRELEQLQGRSGLQVSSFRACPGSNASPCHPLPCLAVLV